MKIVSALTAFFLTSLGMAMFSAAASAAPYTEFKEVFCHDEAECVMELKVVPQGKTETIQHVSCVDTMARGPDIVYLALFVDQGEDIKAVYPLLSEWQGSNAEYQFWITNTPVLAYLKAGQRPRISIHATAAPTYQRFTCTISGTRT